MAVLILNDPLENLANWTNNGATIVAARNGNGANLANFGDITYTIPGASENATLVFSFSYRINDMTTAPTAQRDIFNLYSDSGATLHNQITTRGDGSITLATGGVGQVTSATGLLLANTWHTITGRITMADAPSGVFQLSVDGVSAINVTNIDTRSGGTKTTYDRWRFNAPDVGGGIANTFDDFVLSGGAPTDARVARMSDRALVSSDAVAARLARTSNRLLVRSVVVDARVARASLRALTRLNVTEGQVARMTLRVLNALVGRVRVWTGTSFVLAPVWVWNGTAFVAAPSVRTWNGTAFV